MWGGGADIAGRNSAVSRQQRPPAKWRRGGQRTSRQLPDIVIRRALKISSTNIIPGSRGAVAQGQAGYGYYATTQAAAAALLASTSVAMLRYSGTGYIYKLGISTHYVYTLSISKH